MSLHYSRCLAAGILALALGGATAAQEVGAEPAAANERTYFDLRRSHDRSTQLTAQRYFELVKLQEWSDATGKFKTMAKYVAHDPDFESVKLEVVRGSGRERQVREVNVPVARLNKVCQSRVKQIATLQKRLDELLVAAPKTEVAGQPEGGHAPYADPGAPMLDERGVEPRPASRGRRESVRPVKRAPVTAPPIRVEARDEAGEFDEDPLGFAEVASDSGGALPAESAAVTVSSSDAAAHPDLTGEAVELTTETGTLHGTLLLPSGDGPWPIALIHAGSGPTDRDGNTPLAGLTNNHLKLLAESLAEQGIASLRFDKRGIGQSMAAMPVEEDLRFEMYVQDTVAWANKLREDARFREIYIIGHSEGSLIGIMAAPDLRPNGVVSLCGTGARAGDELREQLGRKLPPPLVEQCSEIIDHLERGETVDDVPAELFVLFRPSVQPYLISWFRIDPVEELRKLDCPVLLVSGMTDIQVSPEHASLLAMARDGVPHQQIEGMNHILKMVSGELQQQLPAYADPDLPIAAAVIELIADFIRTTASR